MNSPHPSWVAFTAEGHPVAGHVIAWSTNPAPADDHGDSVTVTRVGLPLVQVVISTNPRICPGQVITLGPNPGVRVASDAETAWQLARELAAEELRR